MGGYELCVNMNFGWIWIMGEYELWVNMIIGGICIIGEYEFWRGHTCTHTDRHRHQYHDSAWPRGRAGWKVYTMRFFAKFVYYIMLVHIKKFLILVNNTKQGPQSRIFTLEVEQLCGSAKGGSWGEKINGGSREKIAWNKLRLCIKPSPKPVGRNEITWTVLSGKWFSFKRLKKTYKIIKHVEIDDAEKI